MNGNGRHYTISEINALVDSRCDPESVMERDPHIAVCGHCRQRYVQLSKIDRSLHSIPLPETGREFTESLMRRLSYSARMPLAFKVLEHGASLLGTFFVVAFLVAAFLLVHPPAEAGNDSTPLGIVTRGWSAVSESIVRVSKWLGTSLTPTDGLGEYGVWLFGGAAVLALVMLDRILARRFFQDAR
jgi:anti-sigma factor RsiW